MQLTVNYCVTECVLCNYRETPDSILLNQITECMGSNLFTSLCQKKN